MSSTPQAVQLLQQANAAQQAGDLRAAESASRALLRLEPLNSQAHLIMASVHGQRDQHRLACQHALQAAEKMGVQPLVHIAAVTLRLITVGEYERAARLIRRIDPGVARVPALLVEFSQQLSLLEEHDAALRYLDAAIGQGLEAESVAYLRGNYLKFLGRLDEAAREYERSLAINPGFAYAHWALAYLGTPGDTGARAVRIRRVIAATRPDDPDLPYLLYALFKELDAADETDAAWLALEAGARHKRSQVRYDAREESVLFRQLAEATGAGFLAHDAPDLHTPVPIFVIGLPRTGTTLLERVLGGNPQVVLCGELNDFRMQLKWATDHQFPGFVDATSISRLAGVDYAQLGRRYLEHVAWRAPGASHFSDKNPTNFVLAGLILRALPQAKIVHLRRNAMDSCFSNLKELFAANSHPYSYALDDLAGHYRSYSALMAHWHAIAPGRILDVNYEDLVSDPDTSARRVMDYCGLPYDAAQIRVEANAAPVSTASSAQVRQPIHTRNIGGWRRYARQLEPLRQMLDAAAD